MMVVASVSPMPGTVFSKRYSGRSFTRSLSRFSSASICRCSVSLTARLASNASATSGAKPSSLICSAVSRLTRSLLIRPPVCRARMLSIASICIVWQRTSSNPLAPQIAPRTFFAWIDVAFRQQPQPQQLRQIGCIGKVSAVLQSLVFLDRRRVRQMHPVPRVHQSIHQEVPVVRGLHDHAHQLFPVRRQCRSDLLQIVGQALLIHDSIFLVTDHYHTVVRVQLNSAKLHWRASLGLKRERTLTLAPPLPRGEEARQMIIVRGACQRAGRTRHLTEC